MVYRSTDSRTGEVVAIKKIERSMVDEYVEQECLNLARCQHNQIIQFFEVCCLIPLIHGCLLDHIWTGQDCAFAMRRMIAKRMEFFKGEGL